MDISDSEIRAENFYGSSSVYQKILGLNWDTGADDLIFDFENIYRTAEKLDVTKRNILCVAAMFFAPLGLIRPIIHYNQSSYFKNVVEINWNRTKL